MINDKLIGQIELFRFAQNIENNEEFCATGTHFEFIVNLNQLVDTDQYLQKTEAWMFDELIIYRIHKSECSDIRELFYTGNLITSTNKENWKKQSENIVLDIIALNNFDFEDTFDWGINEWLFNHQEVSLNFSFENASRKIQIFEETNPLFLGCELDDYYYLFNYNGYT